MSQDRAPGAKSKQSKVIRIVSYLCVCVLPVDVSVALISRELHQLLEYSVTRLNSTVHEILIFVMKNVTPLVLKCKETYG